MTTHERDPAAVIRRCYDSFNAGDWETIFEFLDPGVAFHASPGIDSGGTYHGDAGARDFLDNFKAHWRSFEFDVARCEEVEPGLVIVEGRAEAVSRSTGLRFDEPFVSVGTVRDGLVTEHGTLFGANEIAAGPGWIGEQLRRLAPR